MTTKPTAQLAVLAYEYLLISLTGFGGNLQTRFEHIAVSKHRWLSSEEFAEVLVLASISPGGNSTNVGLEIARRRHGFAGQLLANACLFLPGAIFVIAAGAAYLHLRQITEVQSFFRGLECASVALTWSTASRLFRKSWGWLEWATAVATVALLLGKILPIAAIILLASLVVLMRPQPNDHPQSTAPTPTPASQHEQGATYASQQ